jgi:hypothetical protein
MSESSKLSFNKRHLLPLMFYYLKINENEAIVLQENQVRLGSRLISDLSLNTNKLEVHPFSKNITRYERSAHKY